MARRGELELISRIRNRKPPDSSAVRLGIGDDCALLSTTSGSEMAVTTDMLVEDVDFRRAWMPPAFLGWKSLAVSLSDVAAMGATPTACLLALALPPELTGRYFDDFVEGFVQACDFWAVPLAGGDISSSSKVCITVTAFGTTRKGKAVCRSGARPGDLVAVLGELGLSRRGLQILEEEQPAIAGQVCSGEDLEKWAQTPDRARALRAHLLPMPHVAEAIWLGENGLAHSMIDVSDGLLADLQHILEESGVAAEIDVDSLQPFQLTVKPHLDLDLVLNGGEDYCLLLTLSPEQFAGVRKKRAPDFPNILAIGRILEGPPSISLLEGGTRRYPQIKGFEHFR
ncbi:MAG: thiamine-phosphate kinase [Acidobacteriota bacterium]